MVPITTTATVYIQHRFWSVKCHYKFVLSMNNKFLLKSWKSSKIPPGGSFGAIWRKIGPSWSWSFSQQESVFKIVKKCIFKSHLLLSIKVLVVTIVIVPLLLPTLFGKRGIFTSSPLLWVFETFSFHLLSA